jgi:putative nucleotidyltransferase with HDIG domain
MFDTILFDWGDTLMRMAPDASGPMVDWPSVEATPGAQEALAVLQKKFRLVVVSGAVDSDAGQVRAALGRVGLDNFFSAVFTSREIGLGKRDPGYYPLVLERLDLPADRALMVGDDYRSDMLAASWAGISGLWLNPKGRAASVLPPVQVGECQTLAGIVPFLEAPRLPAVDVCLGLLTEKGNPKNILAHCTMVGTVAYLLAAWLRKAGVPVDPLLAHRGGLLHDLDKVAARQQGRVHGELAREWLMGYGWPELAEIACRHPVFVIQDPTQKPRTWEERLVFYADKIVERNQIVPVSTRIDRLCERYPEKEAEIRECEQPVLILEERLCKPLACSPEELIERLRQSL